MSTVASLRRTWNRLTREFVEDVDASCSQTQLDGSLGTKESLLPWPWDRNRLINNKKIESMERVHFFGSRRASYES